MQSRPHSFGLRVGRARGPEARQGIFAYVLLMPLLAVLIAVVVLPLVLTAWTSISSTSLNGTVNFGTVMYSRVIADPVVPRAIANSLVWGFASMVLGTWTALLLAALVEDGPVRPKGLFRFFFFAPYFFSMAVAATVFARLYDPTFGLINSVIHAIGFRSVTPQWLGDPGIALWAAIAIFLWHEIPFSFIILSAAIRQIDRHLYEAAWLDGASGPQVFRFVTVPSVLYIMGVLMIVSFISGLLAFAVVFGLTFPAIGGPDSATQILPTLIFQQGILGVNRGEAAALSVLLVVITVGVMMIGVSWSARRAVR